MKNGWQTKKLGELLDVQNGYAFSSKDYSDIAYLDVEAKKFEKRRLQYGDVILEKSGGGPKQPVGRVALFDKEEGNFSFSNFITS